MLLTGEYTIERSGAGLYRKGRYIAGPVETVTMLGSLQPTSARELKLTSEGGRLKQYFKFFTDQPLVTVNSKDLAKADVITINGESYKVMSVEPWDGTMMPYFKSIVYREPEQ